MNSRSWSGGSVSNNRYLRQPSLNDENRRIDLRWNAPTCAEREPIWAQFAQWYWCVCAASAEKKMVDREGVDPPTPGFSGLSMESRKCPEVREMPSDVRPIIVRWTKPE